MATTDDLRLAKKLIAFLRGRWKSYDELIVQMPSQCSVDTAIALVGKHKDPALVLEHKVDRDGRPQWRLVKPRSLTPEQMLEKNRKAHGANAR